MEIIKGEKVCVNFGGLSALKDIDFYVKPKEIFGIVGPNGAGKTTLINTITGLVEISSGRLFFKGKDITRMRPHEISRLGIARTYQLVRPFLRLTTLQNVMVGALYGKSNIHNLDEAISVAEKYIEFVGLQKKKNDLALNLNEVERKRLELARALATNPEVLLLDEVAAGSTHAEMKEIMEIVSELRESGLTICMVEHVMKMIMALADRIMVLHLGMKIAEGSPEKISNNKEVIKVYLGE